MASGTGLRLQSKTLFVHRAATRYTGAAMERLPLANKTPLLSVCVFLAGCSVMPETLLLLNPSSQYPRRSEGAIEPLNDGRLGFVYTRFTGGNKDDSPADIVVRTSRDAGRHWGRERLLVSRDGSRNVMSVSLLRLAGGELLLFYLRKSGCGDCLMYVQRSADELATLSPPVRVTVTDGYHVVNNDRIVQLTGGRIIVPAAWHPCPDGTDKTWSPYAVCRAFFSDDDGRTWQAGADVPPPRETRPVVLQEPGVVELADGRLLMWMRTNQPSQYQLLLAGPGRALVRTTTRTADLRPVQPGQHQAHSMDRPPAVRVERPFRPASLPQQSQPDAPVPGRQPRRRPDLDTQPGHRIRSGRLVLLHVDHLL